MLKLLFIAHEGTVKLLIQLMLGGEEEKKKRFKID